MSAQPVLRTTQPDGSKHRRRPVSTTHSSKRRNTQPSLAQDGDGRRAAPSSESRERLACNGVPPPASNSFDPKTIVPEKKAVKSLARLKEASTALHSTSASPKPVQYIDGHTRNPSSARPAKVHEIPSPPIHASPPTALVMTRHGLAEPTRRKIDEVCNNFLRKRNCVWGAQCNRIHLANPPSTVQKEEEAEGGGATPLPSPQTRAADKIHDRESTSNLPNEAASIGVVATPLPSSSQSRARPQHSALPDLRPTNPSATLPRTRPLSDDSRSSDEYPSGSSSATSISTSPESQPVPAADAKPKTLHRPQLPPNQCRDWVRGSCLRSACKFLHGDNEAAEAIRIPTTLSGPPSVPHRREPSVASVAILKNALAHIEPQKPAPAQSAVSTRPSLTTASKDLPISSRLRRVRPRTVDRCWKWLQDACPNGYNCQFIHDDLDYDDDEEFPLATMLFKVHTHMSATFGPGASVEQITTAFDSRWIIVGNLPDGITDQQLKFLLRQYGEVTQIRWPGNLVSPVVVKVEFAKPEQSFKAVTQLHGKIHFGEPLDVRYTFGDGNRTVVADAVAYVEWDAPSRTCYIGYQAKETAQALLDALQVKDATYDGHRVFGTFHTTHPRAGRFTIKLANLPSNATEEGLRKFGPVERLLWEQPNYKLTVPEAAGQIRKMFDRRFPDSMVDFRPPGQPYTNERLKAKVHFLTAANAAAAAEWFNGRKPSCIAHNRISVRHTKMISVSIPPFRYRQLAKDISSFADFVSSQRGGYSVTVADNVSSIDIRIKGDDLKILVRMKGELERILCGEVVLQDGKPVWSDFFVRTAGWDFLKELERNVPGLVAVFEPGRRVVRVFGPTLVRRRAAEAIISKISVINSRKCTTVAIPGRIVDGFLKGPFVALRKELGDSAVNINLWDRTLVVTGDEKVVTIAREAIHQARVEHDRERTNYSAAKECPVCFGTPSVAEWSRCGHVWCRGCLANYLRSSSEHKKFPLSCLGGDGTCKELIPLPTARRILTPTEFEALYSASLTAYVQQRPDEYRPCHGPDCKQVYRVMPIDSNPVQCPDCFTRVCAHCHSDAHDGLTCKEFTQGEELYREWASSHNVKQCPKCNMGIEKIAGCNHMVCSVCQTHVCWFCMMAFPNSDTIYVHMSQEHGSFGVE